MSNDYHQSEPQQKPDIWFYATIALISLFIIVGVAYIAYQFGQNNTSETKFSETKAINSQIDNPSTVNVNARNPSSNNIPSQTSTVNAIVPVQPVSTSRTISGQVFIVTKGRENIKLALVEICAVPDVLILSWIKSKKETAIPQQKKEQNRIASLKQQKDAVSSQIQAASSRDEQWRLEDKQRELSHQWI